MGTPQNGDRVPILPGNIGTRPYSRENGYPGSLYSREYGDPGPHFAGSIGTRDPHISWKMGTPLEKWGPPVWQIIFWEFRDPQCDAGLSILVLL